MANEFRKDGVLSLMDFLPSYEFRLCVDRYRGNYSEKLFMLGPVIWVDRESFVIREM